MKIKEFTVAVGYTFQPQPYHSTKGEVSLVVEVAEDEDVDVALEEARIHALTNLVRNLAGVELVHIKLYDDGFDPSDVLKEMEAEPDLLAGAVDTFGGDDLDDLD